MREESTYNSTGYKLLHIFNTFIRSFQHKENQKTKKEEEEEEENPPDHTFSFVASSLCQAPPVVLPFFRNKTPFIFTNFFFFHRLRLTNTYEPMQRPNTTWIPLLVSCILHFSLRRCRCSGPALLHLTSLHIDGERGHTHTWTTHIQTGTCARNGLFLLLLLLLGVFFFFSFLLAGLFRGTCAH